ncbi:MAG: hypothetical protein ACOY4D_13990, partial [Pseudomonadota bacterium]
MAIIRKNSNEENTPQYPHWRGAVRGIPQTDGHQQGMSKLRPNEAVEKLSEMPRRRKSEGSKTPPRGEIVEYRASQEVEIFTRS